MLQKGWTRNRNVFNTCAAAAAKSLQSCPTLCNPIDGSPPGSPIPGILQARTLEWVAISFSRGSSQPRDRTQVSCIVSKTLYHLSHHGSPKVKSLSRVRLFATPWTVAHQAPPSMGFSRREYWSGVPFPSLGDLPDPGIEPRSPALQAEALTSEPPGKQTKPQNIDLFIKIK